MPLYEDKASNFISRAIEVSEAMLAARDLARSVVQEWHDMVWGDIIDDSFFQGENAHMNENDLINVISSLEQFETWIQPGHDSSFTRAKR